MSCTCALRARGRGTRGNDGIKNIGWGNWDTPLGMVLDNGGARGLAAAYGIFPDVYKPGAKSAG